MQAIPGTKKLNLEHKIKLCGDSTAPLIYLIHGRAGNYDVMWTFSRLISENCNIIAPQAPHAETVVESNAKGWSWWLAGQADSGVLRSFISEAERTYDLRPKHRVALGFSQGAALLSILIQKEPELFKAAALLAGFVIESPNPPQGRLPDIFMAHGSKDEIISMDKNQKSADFLKARGYNLEYHTEEVGHKIGAKSTRMLGEWLKKQI